MSLPHAYYPHRFRLAAVLIALIACCAPGHLSAQSASHLLAEARHWMDQDTNLALVKLEQVIEQTEPGSALQDSAYQMVQRYYKAATNQRHPYLEKAEAYDKIASHYTARGDSNRLAHLYLQWADLEQEVDLGESEIYASRANALFKATGDTLGMADCQFRLGVLQGSMGNTDLVLQHFQRARDLAEAIQDTAYLTEAYTRIAEYYQRSGQLEEALSAIDLALAGTEQAKPGTLINTYRIKAYLASYQGDYDAAFRQLGHSMELATANKDSVRLAMLQLDMGQLLYNNDAPAERAIKWLERGAATAEAEGSLRFQKSAQLGLSLVHEAEGNADAALYHFRQYYQLDQQMKNEQDRQRLLTLEARYKNEKQAAELAQREAELTQERSRKRILRSSLLFAILLILLSAGAYLYQLKSRRALAEQKKITEAQAEELRELDVAKSRLFANISHELRTPLTLMLGPVSSLLKRSHKDAPERPFLEMIRQNGQQLLRRVNEILDLSKLDAGKLELVEDSVAIEDFVQRQVGMFESLAHQQDIELSFDSTLDEDTLLLIDEDKLGKIISNLLSNALKFTPAGGQVQVSANRKGGQLTLTVEDSGRGIPAKDLEHIFERFYQSRGENSPLQGGTGIGLAFCRELAQLMGGNLHARSEEGKGSSFYLHLPYRVAKAAAAVSEPQPSYQPGAAEGSMATSGNGHTHQEKTGNLLIVEDNPALRNYLRAILEDRYFVHTANNGVEALKHLEKHGSESVDLIVSDVMMPEMNGFTLLERLKEDQRYRHLPVIMLTALARQESRLRALRIGVDDYVLKPFQEEELQARIQSLLNNYRLRRSPDVAVVGSEEAEAPISEKPDSPLHSQEDAEWLMMLEEKTLAGLGDTNFTVDRLAEEMSYSRRQLYRKVKALTGLTPNSYIQEARFQSARQMLEERRYSNVKKVAYEVGFKDTRYFSRQYKERFGRLPSGYLQE